MIEDLIVRKYNHSDENKWLKCRLLSFLDSAYYDDVYNSKPIFDNSTLELVAENNNNIVGIIDIEKENRIGKICSLKSGIGAMIWTIGVLPEYRRHGIAKKLIQITLKWAKENEIDYLEAWTRDDSWVQAWYESLGFTIFDSYWHIYFKGDQAKSIFKSKDKKITPQHVFAHSNKDPKTLDLNKIDRFYKCYGYKIELTN